MKTADRITHIIDLFYVAPLRRLLPLQTFRYAVCGGVNLVFSWLLYALFYEVLLGFDYLNVGVAYVSRHTAALAVTFPLTLLSGYLLQSRISFKGSPLGDRKSSFRYAVTTFGSLAINYVCLKIFVEWMGVYATAAQVITSFITIIYSYLLQKYWTFRGA
ncbi:MAG: GtrA family protein [Tidjanibacter sp.]|nr:GtrA family protein [Tidjanibacter sp.]